VNQSFGLYSSTFGRYSTEAICPACALGKWSMLGSSTCFPSNCGVGTENKERSNRPKDCTSCLPGFFSRKLPKPNDNVAECVACPCGQWSVGYTLDAKTSECKDQKCLAGKYPGKASMATTETEGCTSCPCGRFTEGPKEIAAMPIKGCKPADDLPCRPQTCSAGSAPGHRGSGLAAVNTGDGCTSCEAGRFQPSSSSSNCSACVLCPCGRYSGSTASECRDQGCPVGMQPTSTPGIGRISDTDECGECPAGKFQKLSINKICNSCEDCPCGMFSIQLSKKCSPTTCKVGTAPNKTSATFKKDGCIDCPCGRYSSTPSNAVCAVDSCLPLECSNGTLPPMMTSVGYVSVSHHRAYYYSYGSTHLSFYAPST